MIQREQVESYRDTLGELNTAALGDLRDMLDSLDAVEKQEARQMLFDAMPQVFEPYAISASDVSATFYEEQRALAGSPSKYTPKALTEPVPPESWNSLVGWATSPDKLGDRPLSDSFESLSGGVIKRLTEAAAETQHQNAVDDPDPVAFQRVPAPGCCGFCGMLASRGAAYGSREQAGVVVGRGVPISKRDRANGTKRSGGQAKGVKTRGTREAGESFHDNCKCSVIAVHQGNAVEMQADADKYYDAYRDAKELVDGQLERHVETFTAPDGSKKNRYTWVDEDGNVWSDKERRRAMAQAMNQDADVMDAIALEAFPNRPPAFDDLFEAATPKPSAGPVLTYENVASLSDDELMEAMSSVFVDDPEAWDKIEGIMERRELAAQEEALAKFEPTVAPVESEEWVDPFGTVLGGDNDTDPTKWAARKLTPNERVAEEYWGYAQNQYQTALEELNGVLFNNEYAELARNKGVMEDSLFMGPLHVANKYASDELKAWWAINGRETLTSYRYMALQRPSDRKAWLSVQKQGLHATGSSAERRRLGI
ncbi:VG15 protein [Arthrobacter rhombi]|uniref:VG15 protein n=1 Tax=Arthrobacter rhombi TaxID=71253 RepID=UPI003FD65CDF